MGGHNYDPFLEEEEEDEDDLNDDYTITLPIQTIDISLYFINSIHTLTNQYPELMLHLQNGLNDEDKQHLQNIIKIAEDRKNDQSS